MNLKQAASTLPLLLLIVSLLVGLLGGVSSSARRTQQDEPASQGKPITPAGTLVQDLTTRQAAVGSLPVDFVRSPDRLGPGSRQFRTVLTGKILVSLRLKTMRRMDRIMLTRTGQWRS
jgi:hypothetical protein